MAILFDWYELPEPKDKQREEKILHPRIRLNGSTTTDELRRRIQERSSLTETDVSAVLDALSHVMGEDRIKVSEHFAQDGKPLDSLLEDVIQHAAAAS